MIANFSKLFLRPLNNINKFKFGDGFLIRKRQGQAKLAKKLKQSLQPTYLEVTDTTLSGSSCGQMYKIIIESPVFEGKSKVAQHQMVSDCLQQELKSIHAFNLKTKVPKKAEQQPMKKQEEQAVGQNSPKPQQ